MSTPNLLRRIDLNLLYPPMARKMELLAQNLIARDKHYWAISGLRSWDDQAELYAQGRTTPGPIVTKAKPGQSFHNFAVAVDWAHDADTTRDGLQPTWALEDYKILAEEASKIGLEAAYYWKSFKEGPHVQLPIDRAGLSKEMLARAYANGGYKAVFQLLDKYRW